MFFPVPGVLPCSSNEQMVPDELAKKRFLNMPFLHVFIFAVLAILCDRELNKAF